jgi:hypothetical protein
LLNPVVPRVLQQGIFVFLHHFDLSARHILLTWVIACDLNDACEEAGDTALPPIST